MSDVVHFLSHHTHGFLLRQRCVKWSVKWVHLPSRQRIIHFILHWGSRACCPLVWGIMSSAHIHLCSSHFVFPPQAVGSSAPSLCASGVHINLSRTYWERHAGRAFDDELPASKRWPNWCLTCPNFPPCSPSLPFLPTPVNLSNEWINAPIRSRHSTQNPLESVCKSSH